MANVNIQVAASTDVGLVRQNNEDNFIICPDLSNPNWEQQESNGSIALGEYGTLLVVADGMGGANAGEVASAIAIDTVRQLFVEDAIKESVKSDASICKFLRDVVQTADKNILQHSKNDSNTRGMGTTIVMAWILGTKAYVAWCGDSRCYLFNQKVGYSRLSNDHSYVQELVDKGELEPEMAFDHPYSNIITRCLGDTQSQAEPDVRIQQLKDGDIIMLCSDGLCGYCRDEQISEVVMGSEDMQECRNKLISAALAAGGYDNVTVACAKVEIPEELMPKDEELKSTLNHRPPRNRGIRFFFILLLFVLCAIVALVYFDVINIQYLNKLLKLK